jgi:SAM-dependent methyltransferase
MSGTPPGPSQPEDAYQADLARAHHEGFGALARSAAATLLRELEAAGTARGLVVDLGSGSGILARIVTDAGYEVLGFDLSEAMVRLAASHAPRARFERAAVLDADIPPCVAVTAIGEVLNYAFDARTGVDWLVPLFRRMAGSLLRPGGILLFDVAGPGRGGPDRRRESFAEGDDWRIRSVAQEDAEGAALVRSITLLIRAGDAYRRHDERHELRLYRPGDVESALTTAGFGAIRTLDRYGDFELPSGLTGFLAQVGP